MQSIADVLRFVFPSTGTGSSDLTPSWPAQRGEDDPLSAGSFAPFISVRPSHSDGQQSTFGPGNVPFSEFRTSPFQSPGWDSAPNGPDGGILGGLPLIAGRESDDPPPRGVLYTYADPEQRQVGRPRSQLFDPQPPWVALPTATPLRSGVLTGPDSAIAAL